VSDPRVEGRAPRPEKDDLVDAVQQQMLAEFRELLDSARDLIEFTEDQGRRLDQADEKILQLEAELASRDRQIAELRSTLAQAETSAFTRSC
jgi:predicted RNase H-like nuclease (RuvC/YqgF family)